MGKVDLRSKGVSFNILDEQQRELFEYALSKSNFSGYVKGLMIRDMLGIGYTKKPESHPKTLIKADVESVV